MSDLCREFDISHKTGYRIFTRYPRTGLEGLTDRSRRPYRQANRLPELLESRIVQFRQETPTGELRRSGRSSSAKALASLWQPPAQRTQSLIVMGWSVADDAVHTAEPRALPYLAPPRRTFCGAVISWVSSCSPIAAMPGDNYGDRVTTTILAG